MRWPWQRSFANALNLTPPKALTDATVRCVRALNALDPGADNKAAAIVRDAFRSIFKILPKTLDEGGSKMTVPLYEMFPDIGKAILKLAGPFCGRDMTHTGAFLTLRTTLLENEANASGVSRYDYKARKKIIGADEYDAPPEELLRLYVGGTPFYDFFNARVPYKIDKKDYCRHGICIARPGWGKSQLLGLLLREAVEDPDERAVILVDPHGPLFNTAKERMPPERTVLIDCDTAPPDLNVFDFGVLSPEDALSTFEFLLSSLAGGLSEKQQACVEPLFALLRKIPDANLVTLHDIIVEKPKRSQPTKYANAVTQLDDIHRDFFEHLFYGSAEFQQTKDALQWKVSRALSRPAFRKMFSAKRNSIDIDRFIRERKIVLVKGGEKSLGREGMRILLLYLLTQYYAAGKRREGTNERHLAMMFIDEAHLVLQSNIIKAVLQELRKYNFSFIAATQLWDDVVKEVKPAILGATAIKIIGDVQRDDAEVFARDMFTEGSFIQNLKAVEGSYGEWAIHVAPEKRALKVRCPYGVLEAMKIQRRFTKADKPDCFEAAEGPNAKKPPEPLPSASVRPANISEPQRKFTDHDEPVVRPGKDWLEQ